MNRDVKRYKILDAQAPDGATVVGTPIKVSDFRQVVVVVAYTGGVNPDITLKVRGGFMVNDTETDGANLSTAATAAKPWDYVEVVDLNSGTDISGDTGVQITTAAPNVDIRQYEVNTNLLDYVTIEATGGQSNASTVSVWLIATDNQ